MKRAFARHFATVALVAGTAFLAVAAAALAATGSTYASGKPVVIGASLSLSGDFSADGQAFQKGYQLWAADVNKHGGLLGRPVKLDIVSDSSSPTQVVTNYQKLINADHVDMLAGPFSTLLTVPSSKIAARYGYAMVEGAGGGPQAFANGLHNLFDVSLPVANNLVTFAHWIASMPKAQRPKTAAYPTSNDPFTQPQVTTAQKILAKAGVNSDVAEGYSVGEVIAQAVKATGGFTQSKIIRYLHSGVTLNTVQGSVKFNSLGQNTAAKPFAFQWQKKGTFVQVLPVQAAGSVKVEYPKPAWGK